MNKNNFKIAIIGLGYVGLPLALEFQKKYLVLGFDTNKKRINELKCGLDNTLEVKRKDLQEATQLTFTNDTKKLRSANCYIVTVPTPVDVNKNPDLKAVNEASELIGKVLKKNDIVIFESTAYPGCTEENCVPILEKFSKLKFNKDFFCGYSPERINPGDKNRKVYNIKKITSGSTSKITDLINDLYSEIITAGTHKVYSIKVAEAAKVIENIQRDINIALINELAILFNKLGIDTEAVLEAAGSKWNFLNFRPGLVGGHCIGVDPYYLTHKAASVNYYPEIILSGRRINEGMGSYISAQLIKNMCKKNITIKNSKILIMGLTFKENCTDLRNSGVKSVIKTLMDYNCNIEAYDPWVKLKDAKKEFNIKILKKIETNKYDAIVLAVAHNKFKSIGIKTIRSYGKKDCILYDLKYLFKIHETDLRL